MSKRPFENIQIEIFTYSGYTYMQFNKKKLYIRKYLHKFFDYLENWTSIFH